MPESKRYLPTDSAARKRIPMFSGLLAYFPDALAAVAEVSFEGNEKHNPGEPLHHARGKSMDHADCIIRHVSNHGGFDGNTRESAALAWRALALLQEELENDLGLSLPRGAVDERAKATGTISSKVVIDPHNPPAPAREVDQFGGPRPRIERGPPRPSAPPDHNPVG